MRDRRRRARGGGLAALIAVAACGGREATPSSSSSSSPPSSSSSSPPSQLPAAFGSASPDGSAIGPCPVEVAELGPGLVAERWHVADAAPVVGEPCIDVVRADPARYELRALARGRYNATAWRLQHALVAVTNAGMFHDGGAPVGLVIADGVTHGIDNKKFGGAIAWHPREASSPAVAMLCGPERRAEYRSLVQSYRLLDCAGRAIRWQDPKHYSAAAIGVDRDGRIVFVHVRAAFTMAELSAALASRDLQGAVFLEGGPEASLVVHGPNGKLERVGSYETGFNENDDNTAFWELPNVIGLVKR